MSPTENTVSCPICDAAFDAVAASFVGTGPACPGCGATWKQLCAAVGGAPDPDAVTVETNHDGTTTVREVRPDV